jgi:hypothetical protein
LPREGRLWLRGRRGAQDEFTLAAIAQNVRRLAKVVARPPPQPMACVAQAWHPSVPMRKSRRPLGARTASNVPLNPSMPRQIRAFLQRNRHPADDQRRSANMVGFLRESRSTGTARERAVGGRR